MVHVPLELAFRVEAERPQPPVVAANSDGDLEATPEEMPEVMGPITDMERFFDLFPDRRLASDIFAVVEGMMKL